MSEPEDRFEREALHVANRLRSLAADVERAGTARSRHHGFGGGQRPTRLAMAEAIHRQVTGALRDLDLGGLVIVAAQEDLPLMMLTPAQRLDKGAEALEDLPVGQAAVETAESVLRALGAL